MLQNIQEKSLYKIWINKDIFKKSYILKSLKFLKFLSLMFR